MFEARALTKRYGGLLAVDRVSFQIQRGEILGYLGPNGSGKSTTINMVVGLIDPSGGSVALDGLSLADDPIAYKRRIGYVPEEPHLYTHLTAGEYLMLIGGLRGLPRASLAARSTRLLQLFELSDSCYAALASFSKGMRQRVLLAAALLHDPDLLVLDEPFSGLDVAASALFRTLLQMFVRDGRMILFSSHRFDVVERVCSHAAILHRGRLVATADLAAMRPGASPSLEEVFARVTEQADCTDLRARDSRRGARRMNRKWRDAPLTELTRHFFREFFYLRFLSDAGADGVRRTAIGLAAGMISLLIFFPQIVVARYAELSARPSPEPYRAALLGGQLLTISLSMCVAALVAILICQSVFPDETDYRILSVLPLTRRLIVGSKLLALLTFASVFMAANVVVFGIGFAVASGGRWADPPVAMRIATHAVVVGLASMYATAMVVAVQGLVVLASPRAWWRSTSAASQSAMAGALILSVPLVLNAGSDTPFLQARRPLLYAVPPGWFLGLEQILLGTREAYFARLALMALLGSLATTAVILGAYLHLYRAADRLAPRSAGAAPRGVVPPDRHAGWQTGGRIDPVRATLTAFTVTPLRRSAPHQFVFVTIVACGFAFAVNRLLAVPSLAWVETGRLPTTGMIAVVSAPLVLMLAAVWARPADAPVSPRAPCQLGVQADGRHLPATPSDGRRGSHIRQTGRNDISPADVAPSGTSSSDGRTRWRRCR